MKYATYENTKQGITKDGHTMTEQDIVKDLNRKSYLEGLVAEARAIIEEYEKAQRIIT